MPKTALHFYPNTCQCMYVCMQGGRQKRLLCAGAERRVQLGGDGAAPQHAQPPTAAPSQPLRGYCTRW